MKPCCTICIAALLSVVIAGCGKTQETQPKAATQVVAKVNSDEITVYQVNYALARTPNVTPATQQKVKREILDNLINEQLAKQQAVAQKLDRNPDVLRALEAARTEILAKAYTEQVAATQPRPTAQEVSDYYADHPELFSERRIFTLEEISLEARPGVADKLREQVAKGDSLSAIGDWLRSQKVPFQTNTVVRPAEDISLDYLPQLHRLKDGQAGVFQSGGNVRVIHIVASKTDPINEAAVAPRIRQFLINKRSNEAVAKALKEIKQQAKVQYVGEFAAGAPAASQKVEAVQAPAPPPVDKARAAAGAGARDAKAPVAASTSKAQALPEDVIAKGVGGIK